MKHTMIEVKQLALSPDNARRTDTKAAMEEMKASILAHGVMLNLLVTDDGDGRFLVVAGGRRLEAVRQLQQEGLLPDDYAVPCQIVGGDSAFEMSLAENTVRQAMHPADEFEAFARLADSGDTIDAIASRFGVTPRHVEQRLKLARVAPELLAAYREEALTLECLMAFTVTDDHAKQREVYQSLQPWQVANPREIRATLTGEMLEASSKLVKFVGLDAYHEAGGPSRADLFGEQVYLEDAELLHRLVAEKLEAARRELEAEGWKWVEVNPDRDWSVIHACGRIDAQPVAASQELLGQQQQAVAEIDRLNAALENTESDELIDALDDAEARLADIEEQLQSFAAFHPEQMRSAGCYVSIGQDGQLDVEKGLIAPGDRKAMADGGDHRPRKPKGMPESLCRDLESYRLQAAQVEIATHPLVALDLLTFTIALHALSVRPMDGGPDLRLAEHLPTPAVQKAQTQAGEALTAVADGLPLHWLNQQTEAGKFQAFLALSEQEKRALLAYGVARSLKPQLSTRKESTAYELALSLTDGDVARYWRPTHANYFGRITRDQLLALGRQLLGDEWASSRSRDKKGELAAELERIFANPERHALPPQRIDAVRRWLPGGMGFGHAEPLVEETAQRQAA